MANRHVKVINGRRYYYESIRVGKKVTSRYLGPVERIRKKKTFKVQQAQQEAQTEQAGAEQEMQEMNEELASDENYIG